MRRRTAFFRVCFMVLALGPAACASNKGTGAAPVQGLPMLPEERLGVDDVFEVRVFQEADLSGVYRVAADGTVDYPFVGRIKVIGMRSGEVQAVIADRLRDGYVKNPQVSVMVKEWNSRKVAVIGQVQKPGPVVYYPSMTIVEAIAAAGGFNGIAAKNSVTVRREVGGVVQSHSYAVGDISAGKAANVFLQPGDIIVVEERLF